MFIVAIIGAATAIFAATIGLAQNDIKKVLAYSTISQLGYMFLACGMGAFVAAIFHVITHAFFKALLFLGSGSVIHGMHHEQDMRRMGGLRKYMPITFATMLTGLVGDFRRSDLCRLLFQGRDSVEDLERRHLICHPDLEQSALGNWRADGAADRRLHDAHDGDDVLGQGALSTKLTTHHEQHAEVDASWHARAHESPWIMTVPLIVLAVLSTVGGLIGVPYALGSLFSDHPTNYIEQTLEPVDQPNFRRPTITHWMPQTTDPHWLSPAAATARWRASIRRLGRSSDAVSCRSSFA